MMILLSLQLLLLLKNIDHVIMISAQRGVMAMISMISGKALLD